MEQFASQCHEGFLHHILQETTGRLEEGCGIISDAYIHYYYKLQASYPRYYRGNGIEIHGSTVVMGL